MRPRNRLASSLLLFWVALVGVAALVVPHLVPTPAPTIPYQAPHPPLPVEIPPAPGLVAPTTGFRAKLAGATVPLYVDLGGAVRFACTATAIDKIPKGYVFLTARHCVTIPEVSAYFIMPDAKADAPYVRASVLIAGSTDTDAALILANYSGDLPTIPIGTDKLLSEGSRVEYYGYPMNLGKLYFEGYVSSTAIGPPAFDDSQWKGDLGLTLPVAGGSSGSALVDPNQEAIVGVVTGLTVGRPAGGVILTMATPSTKVRQLVSDYKSGRVRVSPDENFWLKRFFGN